MMWLKSYWRLTLLVLVVESHFTSGTSRNHHGSVSKNSSSECWTREEYDIIEPCHPCTDFEITSQSNGVCLKTHFKEVLKCQKSGVTVTRSCEKVQWLEERNFWIFESLMFVIGVISTAAVFARQKVLDHRMLRRVQKQLASGV
ncbi:protein JTB isoform X2 [Anabrus simplex]|uniref:protein JTB isoform X2 n=1 Tax=Anabrus simplex TaxID=316456 RepID=UPI0034DD363E